MKINGSLIFDASSASEIQNLRVQKYALIGDVPAYGSSDAGRLVFVSGDGALYYGSPATGGWVKLATGGNAASLQTEVDAIETSLGGMVSSSGTWVSGALSGSAFGSASDLTTALNNLASYAVGHDTLGELLDVNVATGLADGQYLKYNSVSGKWVNDTLTLADVTDVNVPVAQLNLLNGLTATAAELNVLDGVTGTTAADISSIAGYAAQGVTATEFGYLDATSSIQTQLNNKQALDATLTNLAALSGTGIVVETGVDSFTHRSLVEPTEGLTISNPDGVLGDITFALANDLAALEGLNTTGLVVRTGDGTAATVSISGSAGRISVTNPAGASGSSPTIDLVAVTDSLAGTFKKITVDGYGRVTGTEAVTTADITALVDTTYVNVNGDTMTGNLTMGTGTYITLNSTAVAGTDAVNKAYVDAATSGLSWKNAVKAASVANLTLSGAQTVDGVALVAGDRVLVKDQTTASENGIYVVAAGAWTRALDMNDAAEFDGSAVFVQGGTVNEGTGWTETATVTTVGTSAVAFSQFSGGQAFIWGTGLSNTGNTVFVNLGAGIVELPSDEIGLDIVAGKAIQLDGALSSSKLTFVLDGAGLEQSAAGLKISTAGVTNAMLANSSITLDGDNVGTGTVALGGTISVFGTSTQGITTSLSGSTFTLTALDADTLGQKGVATFDAGDFAVASGVVSIKTAGVDNAQLANSTINFIGTDASADTVALGESLTFASAVTGLVSATVATNGITLGVRLADASNTGVASFNAAHFAVSSGAVSLDASLDDLNNVAGADGATAGDLLTKGATDWEPVSRTTLAGTIPLGALQDVGTATPTATYALIGDGTAWQSKKIFHVQDVATAATSWTVTHGLGTKYCNVTIVDDTDNVVIPQSIVFTNTTTLTVTFNTAIAGKVVVMGIA